MTDIFLKEFYDAVKDESWPTVNDYIDIKNLPPHIKHELDSLHNFETRKKEIVDRDYWAEHSHDGCFMNHQDCFFLSINKCASSFWYENLVKNNGWEKSSLSQITSTSTVISACINPIDRYKKGIAEFFYLYFYNKLTYSLSEIYQMIDATNDALLVPDVHTLPYDLTLRKYFKSPVWIPIDILDVETTNQIVANILKTEKQYEFTKGLINTKIYESSHVKTQIYKKVSNHFDKKPENIYRIYNLLADDLKFYYNLIDNFSISDYI